MVLKELFTRQFVKDLIWSVIILSLLYALTHNPITRPIARADEGKWSIHFMQHPLIFGFAGHNYIALYDADGNIVSELHGLATNPQTGEWRYIGTKSTDLLKVWEFDASKYYLASKNFPGRILAEGNKDEMLDLWKEAEGCKEPINNQNISYPMFGFSIKNETINSNSVAYTLTRCMGLDARHIGLITPGSDLNLLKNYLDNILIR